MRKLRLSLEHLRVESFAPDAPRATKSGTVQGHAKATYACTEGWDGCPDISINNYTCDVEACNGVSYEGPSCDWFTCVRYPTCWPCP